MVGVCGAVVAQMRSHTAPAWSHMASVGAVSFEVEWWGDAERRRRH